MKKDGKHVNRYVYGVGISGNKYPISINNKNTKEYKAWGHVLERCYSEKYKEKHPTYKNVTCCDEWLYYPNFYEWLHSQENFEKWYNGERWAIDKDILNKNNNIYSSTTCCLVPHNVNGLFTKSNKIRGCLPIGVVEQNDKFLSFCKNYLISKKYHKYLGSYNSPEEAFLIYKTYKEDLIKQVAEIEYEAGNITKQCYDAMMNYEVEITD